MTTARERALSWAGPLVVTALGGALRWRELATPRAFVFDETYYAKDAYSLLLHGHERQAVAGANEVILAAADPNTAKVFTDTAAFVVHPPFGKWLIAAGEAAFGLTPHGWRVAVALAGTLSILVLARAVRRMTGSALWGTVAGLLLAIDGLAIVTSRTAILDGLLMFWVLVAFALLLIDRDRARSGGFAGRWWRPWRLWAAVALGLACSVKWSAVWYALAFGLLSVAWDAGRRRQTRAFGPGATAGPGWPAAAAALRGWLAALVPAGITMVVVVAAVYLATWYGWFTHADAWGRSWAGGDGAWDALRSLNHYHAEMLGFHNQLDDSHGYQSSAWGWLVQARPTAFYYGAPDAGAAICPSGTCSAVVTSLGNPLLWWAATLALLHQAWRWIGHRDWRAAAVLVGVAAGWVPWLLYPDRTIFTFYAVVFLPYLVIALTLSLALVATPSRTTERLTDTRGRQASVAALLLALVATSWYFAPIWTGQTIDQQDWATRIRLPTWR